MNWRPQQTLHCPLLTGDTAEEDGKAHTNLLVEKNYDRKETGRETIQSSPEP